MIFPTENSQAFLMAFLHVLPRKSQELTAPRRFGHLLPLRAHGGPGPLHWAALRRRGSGNVGLDVDVAAAQGSEVVPPRAETQEETAVRRDILEISGDL